jgi:hypothetical protein
VTIDPAAFMAATYASAPAPLNGNTPWAARYAAELRRVVKEHAARAPRSLQLRLGPSELGVVCDRQVVGKMAGLPHTNHVVDPWPSVVGTAVHAWLADAFDADNLRHGVARWVTEQRVETGPDGTTGTADLYDGNWEAVVDHKILGPTSMAKVKAAGGPPLKYQRQLRLYGLGYLRMGLPVQRVVLAAYPRTKPSLDELYVWEAEMASQETVDDLEWVFKRTTHRRDWALAVHEGRADISDVPAFPSSDECYFCPFYRPEVARGAEYGCPGTVK